MRRIAWLCRCSDFSRKRELGYRWQLLQIRYCKASPGCGAAQHGCHLTGEEAAIAVRHSDFSAVYLPLASRSGQLPIGFDNGKESVHARVSAGQTAAVGIYRKAAAGTDYSGGDKVPALPLLAEAKVFKDRMIFGDSSNDAATGLNVMSNGLIRINLGPTYPGIFSPVAESVVCSLTKVVIPKQLP